ncbi:MAG: isochorismatase family protein, partial [Nitrososphaeria archaeon]|nr:isochorismatase family protein [Nitrososphaeria archaeon]
MPKEALVVIDMLRDFVQKGAPLEVAPARVIVPHLQRRIQEARQRGAAIIYVCDAHHVDDEEFAK